MSDINQLRTHLFETLQGLRDEKNPMDIERARAVSDVAQTIVNSVKVEIDYMKQTGESSGSGFIPAAAPGQLRIGTRTEGTSHGTKTIEQLAGASITTHKMR